METMTSGGAPTSETLIAALNAKLLREQNLVLGIITGAAASLAGALIWMGITVVTQMHIGLVAIAVGAGVGYAVRYAGKGVAKVYGVIGAVFTLLSCLAGEMFSVIQFTATADNISFFDALSKVDFSMLIPAIIEGSSVMTWIIYGIGVYEGYKFSFRKLTPAEIQEAGFSAPTEPSS